jgi:cytochrome c556
MRRASRIGAGAILLGLALLIASGAVTGGGSGEKASLPKDVLASLVAHDAKAIREGLAKGARDKKTKRRVRVSAFMIAVYAQAALGPGNASNLTALRDNALQVVKLVEDGKIKEAAKLAERLSVDAQGAGGKIGPVAWEKQLSFEDLMHQFSGVLVGGFGIEKELGDLGEKDSLTAEQLERLRFLGYKLAMIGRVTDAYAEVRNEGGNKTRSNWLKFAQDFRAASRDLSQAAGTKNQAATRAALEKLTMSCTKCHDVFR